MNQKNNLPKPAWLTIKPAASTNFSTIKTILKKHGLVTVCEEAHCPNMAECWHQEGTATFMVLGDTCTRACSFCAVATARTGKPVDPQEPQKLAQAIAEIGLDYAVITSVDRDDLIDQGSQHFSACIRAIKQSAPTLVEVLTPDFRGETLCLDDIINAEPHVFAHNIETIPRLHKRVRDSRAKYSQSLNVLKYVKEKAPHIYTKSAIMLGLGETPQEVIATMQDLRSAGCDILTLGQYLKPKTKYLPVEVYITPQQFKRYEQIAKQLGFLYVASGPFVRSSYKAGELFMKEILSNQHSPKQPSTVSSSANSSPIQNQASFSLW